MTDFGADVSTYPDLDPTFAWSTSATMLGQAIARRLETKNGTLAEDPDYGLDLRDFLHDDMGPRERFVLAAQTQAECEKDERVLAATVTVGDATSLFTLVLNISIEPLEDAAFKLTLGINDVGATVLSVIA